MGGGVKATPRPLYPRGKRTRTHCARGWVGPRAGLDRCEKVSPTPGFSPRTAQPVASQLDRYRGQKKKV